MPAGHSCRVNEIPYIEVMSVCYLVTAPEQTDVLSSIQHNCTESC